MATYTVVRAYRSKEYASWSVCLLRKEDKLRYWIDVWVSGEDVDVDWNQYIFWHTDTNDMHRKSVQDSDEEFDEASCDAICFLEDSSELFQDQHGCWSCKVDKATWGNGETLIYDSESHIYEAEKKLQN